ncbi:acyl-CoA thioester hydrolase [Ulvibacter sp. MAR_2010_11]|nr:acyl-CoA thioester hydrolase [Ulvibacter sp. MAR_2010_11]
MFSYQFIVPNEAIDERKHVNNLTYLEWCIHAAEAHWKSKASLEMQKNFVWYVLRHHIEYKAAAFEDEKLQIETWVTSSEGVRSERNFKIFRIKDQKLLVEASTLWCLLDQKTNRPTKIPEEITTLFL